MTTKAVTAGLAKELGSNLPYLTKLAAEINRDRSLNKKSMMLQGIKRLGSALPGTLRSDRPSETADSQGSSARSPLFRLRPRAVIGVLLPKFLFPCLDAICLLAQGCSLHEKRVAPVHGVIVPLALHGGREAEKVFARKFRYVSLVAKRAHDIGVVLWHLLTRAASMISFLSMARIILLPCSSPRVYEFSTHMLPRKP